MGDLTEYTGEVIPFDEGPEFQPISYYGGGDVAGFPGVPKGTGYTGQGAPGNRLALLQEEYSNASDPASRRALETEISKMKAQEYSGEVIPFESKAQEYTGEVIPFESTEDYGDQASRYAQQLKPRQERFSERQKEVDESVLARAAGSLARGWRSLVDQVDQWNLAQHQDIISNKEADLTTEQLAGDVTYNEAKAAAAKYEANLRARGKETAELYPLAKASRKGRSQGEFKTDSWLEQLKNVGESLSDDPMFLPEIMIESGPATLEMAVAALAARAGIRTPGAAMAGGGAASAFQDYASTYANEFLENGGDHKAANENAIAHAGFVGLLDAFSINSVGKAVGSVLGKQSVASKVIEAAKETGRQAGLGAGGETLGTFAQGRVPDPYSVAAEALGEVGGAVATAPVAGAQSIFGQPGAGPAPPAPPAPPTPAPVGAPMEPSQPSQEAPQALALPPEALPPSGPEAAPVVEEHPDTTPLRQAIEVASAEPMRAPAEGEATASQVQFDPSDPIGSMAAIAAAPVTQITTLGATPSTVVEQDHGDAAGDLAGVLLHIDQLQRNVKVTPPANRPAVEQNITGLKRQARDILDGYAAQFGPEAASHLHTLAAQAFQGQRRNVQLPSLSTISEQPSGVNNAEAIRGDEGQVRQGREGGQPSVQQSAVEGRRDLQQPQPVEPGYRAPEAGADQVSDEVTPVEQAQIQQELEAEQAAIVPKNGTVVPKISTEIDREAHAAAPSTTNERLEPTPAQIEAGNYKKGHPTIGGIALSIENPEGSTRKGVSPEGKPWAVTMKGVHYGYAVNVQGRPVKAGKDGKPDVFVRAGTPPNYSGRVFVVNQVDPATGKFDETKTMVGWPTMASAKKAYLDQYDHTGKKRIGSIEATDVEGYKAWLEQGQPNQPFARGGVSPMGSMGAREPAPENSPMQNVRIGSPTASIKELPDSLALAADEIVPDGILDEFEDAKVRNINSSERRYLYAILRDVLKTSVNPKLFDGITAFAVTQDDGAYAYHMVSDTGEHIIALNEIYFSPSWTSYDHSPVFSVLHELGHEVDNTGVGTDMATWSSPITRFNVDGEEIIPEGPVAKEAVNYFKSHDKTTDPLAALLRYPLENTKAGTFGQKIAAIESMQKELFAQLNALWYTAPSLMKRELPQAYKLMKEIHENAGDTVNGHRVAVQEALRSRRAVQPETLGRGFASRHGRAGKRGAGEGVEGRLGEGKKASVERSGEVREAVSAPTVSPRGPSGDDTVSTRNPTAKKAEENPLTERTDISLEAMKRDPSLFDQAVNVMKEYANFERLLPTKNTERLSEQIIQQIVDNLLWLHDQVPTEIRARSKKWYDGANKIANEWAKKYAIQPKTAAGVMAVLSPQKDWFMNVSLAQRVLDTITGQQNTAWSREMTHTAERILKLDKPAVRDLFSAIHGKRLSQLSDPLEKAYWIRIYDEAHNDRSYHIVSPEGKNEELARNSNGQHTKVAWGDFGSIAKAVSIFDNPSFENISNSLGNQHKVRNFYNNIISPDSRNGHITIDTHAVAAALIQPLSGNTAEVFNNFGSSLPAGVEGNNVGSSSKTGVGGTYAIYAEAYRRAAKERGILPREMQSITWEAVRGLFIPKFKGNSENVDAVQSIWRSRDGIATKRKKISDLAGGIRNPEWVSGPRLDEGSQRTPDQGELLGLERKIAAHGRGGLKPSGNVPRVIVNVGLDTNDGLGIIKDEVLEALEAIGVEVVSHEVRKSNTEQTVVAVLDRPLTDEEADKLSRDLKQEAIAQKVGGEGKLHGPKAAEWGPFNQEFFLEPASSKISAMARLNPLPQPPGNNVSWSADAPTRLDSFIRALQDRHVDMKKVVAAIKEAGKNILDELDTYLQEELYHGRAAKAVSDFIDRELKPLTTEMAARGIPMKALEEYLHNRHAEERNIQIAKVNPQMQDGGSGINTADARAYLASIPPDARKSLEALAARVDSINKKTTQLLVNYGLESQDTVDAWNSAYKSYVPLHRADMDGSGPSTGRGYSVKGSSSKRATGSTLPVENILGNIALAREAIIARGEKNRVATSIVGLAHANPNPGFWKVDRPPMIKFIGPDGLVHSAVDPLYKSKPNVIVARIPRNGKIEEHSVIFNESNERAMAMAEALNNLDGAQLGEIASAFAKGTRYLAAINTQYNPVFGIVNLTRDTLGSLLTLTNTAIAGKQLAVLKEIIPSLVGVYRDLRAERAGKPAPSAQAARFEEFQREGGQTAFRNMFLTSEERANDIQREIAKASAGNSAAAMKAGRWAMDWLSDYNTAMENAVRFAAYKVAVDSGVSKQRAASIAKNITVNFNRKGRLSGNIGAFYAFFGASVQGTARIMETLKGPQGAKIIAGGITIGVLQAFALAAAGFDDDEPPEFIQERNLLIPIGGKKYVSVPLPLGFNFLPNIGRIAAQYTLSGFKDGGKRAGNLMMSMLDSFNPLGSATLAQTAAPTIADPLVALAENKDFTGRPIARENVSQLAKKPGHLRAKEGATEFSKAVSKAINALTGGTEFIPGGLSPTPDQIDYLIGQVTGGVGRELGKASTTVQSAITGEELPPHKVPLVGRFYGSTEAQASQSGKFYDNLKRLNDHEAQIKGLRAEGNSEEARDYIKSNPDAALVSQANDAEKQVRDLRKKRTKLIESGAPKSEVKAVEDKITTKMSMFNAKVKALR